MPIAEIYTDGACARNGQPDASMGIGVFWSSPHSPNRNVSEPYYANRRTNQIAEIEAARRGISDCKRYGYDQVIVMTDSRYVIEGIRVYMPRWIENGFRNSSGFPVANASAFKRLYSTISGIEVDFQHVPSRQNLADRLAKSGAQRAYLYDSY